MHEVQRWCNDDGREPWILFVIPSGPRPDRAAGCQVCAPSPSDFALTLVHLSGHQNFGIIVP